MIPPQRSNFSLAMPKARPQPAHGFWGVYHFGFGALDAVVGVSSAMRTSKKVNNFSSFMRDRGGVELFSFMRHASGFLDWSVDRKWLTLSKTSRIGIRFFGAISGIFYNAYNAINRFNACKALQQKLGQVGNYFTDAKVASFALSALCSVCFLLSASFEVVSITTGFSLAAPLNAAVCGVGVVALVASFVLDFSSSD